MITIISNGGELVAIGTVSGGEYGLTNVGAQVQLPSFVYITVGTNVDGYTNYGLHDGAIVAVDGGGNFQVADGPDVALWMTGGFAAGISVLGFFVFIRWIYRVFFGAAGIHQQVSDS